MRPLDTYARLGSIIAILLLVAISAYAGHWLTNAHWSAKWQDRDNADLTAQIEADKRELKLQNDWQAKINQVTEDGKKTAELLEANIDNFAAVNDKLRESAEVSASKYEGANSIITRLRASAATSDLVRRELLGYCLTRIEQLAGIADRSRAAGLSCQKAYNAIRLQPVLQ